MRIVAELIQTRPPAAPLRNSPCPCGLSPESLEHQSAEGALWRIWPKDQPLHLSPQQAVDGHSVEASPPTPFWFDWKTRLGPTSHQDVFNRRELAGFVSTGHWGPSGPSTPLGFPGRAVRLLRLWVGLGVVQAPPGDKPASGEGGSSLDGSHPGLSWASWISRCSLS